MAPVVLSAAPAAAGAVSATGTLYATTVGPTALHTVDRTTGASTLVGIASASRLTGLAFVP